MYEKTFLLYVQSWMIGDVVDTSILKGEKGSDRNLDKKSYLQKTRDLLLELRRCDIYNMIRGYQEGRGWRDGQTSYAIHGNPGCEDLFRKLVDISIIGKIWELNSDDHHLRIVKQDEDFHQLTRRFGRYKKMRTEALKLIRDEREKENKTVEYVGWKTAHAKVIKMRESAGYDSEIEERHLRERKGKGK